MEHELSQATSDKHPALQQMLVLKLIMINDWLHHEMVKEADFSYTYRARRLYI